MKVSDFLRQYQITGAVPDSGGDSLVAFWGGWLIGATRERVVTNLEESISVAIKAAEFIEDHARS